MALIDLSVVEQRYRSVLAVEAGARVGEVATSAGVSRQSLHSWVSRYREQGLAGLADRSRRPVSSPNRSDPVVEAAVCELRRRHPKWGPQRIFAELARNGCPGPVPARMTVYRILARHGLIEPAGRRRKRQYRRWQRDAPMQLWQLDIVGGVLIANPSGGSPVEAKVVTGVDDCSRFAVIATVVPRASGRAVCLAFATALQQYGVPEEVLTDNGKQFTARFGAGGEVLFDRICRDNGITHRLTAPASPTTTGKIERLHKTLRGELLDDAGVFASIEAAQAAVDRWRVEYNQDRPHQSLDLDTPARRFAARPDPVDQALLPLKLPAALTSLPAPGTPAEGRATDLALTSTARPVAAVEFERVVPPSGNLWVAGRQFWLSPARAGLTVTFWADTDRIHLLIAGTRIKTLRSHLSTTDLTTLAAQGARPAGPSPLPPVDGTGAVELERAVSQNGTVALGGHRLIAAELLAGRQVGIRIDKHTLAFYDPDTRQLLRTRPSPFSLDQARLLRGARPAGPPPRPAIEPVTVQRRASATGTLMIAGQVISVGRGHAGQTITAHVADTTITIDLGDTQTKTVARTTSKAIRNIKADRPRKAANDF